MARVSLDGDGWQVRGCLGEEWRWHVGPDKPWDAPGWLPARVPGSVLDDLIRAGEVANVRFERNSRLAEWVPERDWIYRRRFHADGERAWVELAGVDHHATVFLDGHEIGTHEGAFTPFAIEVGAGEHLLAVVVHAAPENVPQVGMTSRVHVHKSRMGYGWDFCPRLVHQGIWRPVTLWVDEPPLVVSARVTVEGGAGVVRADGELELLDGDEVVARGTGELRLEEPRRWWPNGLGEQHLYRLRVAGRELVVGFRTIAVERYRVTVNGVPMPVKGWNWVPIDALYGVPRPEKLEHLLRLAARANVNLLRVWGGGLIETPEFYDLCDRLGLLVWQEFAQSSSGIESVPSDDPAFVELMEHDARRIVPARRHHPSLAIWCGGNELDGDDSTPVLAALRAVVRELDPDRAWLPTSPLGEDDLHGPWEHQGLDRHHAHYDSRTALLQSEFGVEGMTNRRSLEALIAPEHRWPADRSNPVYEHLGAWWNNAPLVQAAFGGRIEDAETMRRASQWLQYEGLRYAVEAVLRRGAGSIPWQFDEPFPNAWCTTAVDYRGDPKPAYWGVARAYGGAPSARFDTSAWGSTSSGGRDEVRAEVSAPARLLDLDGRVVAEGDSTIAAPLADFAHDVFVLDVGGNRYVMSRTSDLAPLLDLPRAELRVERASDALSLANTGAVAALGIVLEDARAYDADGWVRFSDNVLDLLPGEERTIELDGPVGELLVEGWNARG